MLVAGPAGEGLDRAASAMIPLLEQGLPAGTKLRRENAGGGDGVTGCNQFEARVAPDGGTILLLPGQAPLAWLTGDPRAKFDAARFIPVLAGVAPGVLVSRRPLAGITATAPLRLAAARPDSPDLAALLALDLAGVPVRPVFGLEGPAAASAVAATAADAQLLLGPDAPARAEAMQATGVVPVLSLGMPQDDGTIRRDPYFTTVPVLAEVYSELRGGQLDGPRYAAWQAVAVTAQLNFMLALQPPTPAAMVALWRQAASHAVAALAEQLPATLRVLPAPAVNRFAAPLAIDSGTLFELRRWMAGLSG